MALQLRPAAASAVLADQLTSEEQQKLLVVRTRRYQPVRFICASNLQRKDSSVRIRHALLQPFGCKHWPVGCQHRALQVRVEVPQVSQSPCPYFNVLVTASALARLSPPPPRVRTAFDEASERSSSEQHCLAVFYAGPAADAAAASDARQHFHSLLDSVVDICEGVAREELLHDVLNVVLEVKRRARGYAAAIHP